MESKQVTIFLFARVKNDWQFEFYRGLVCTANAWRDERVEQTIRTIKTEKLKFTLFWIDFTAAKSKTSPKQCLNEAPLGFDSRV